MTDVAVSTTMREANDRGFDCLLLEDGTMAHEPTSHVGVCESIKKEGGVLGCVGKLDDIVRAVENFRNATVKRLAPQMNAVA